MTSTASTTNISSPPGPPEMPTKLQYELKTIREMQERLSLGISQMVRNFGDTTHGELQDYCRMSELMTKRTATLRIQLEKIDPTGLYDVCKKLWDVEWESKQLSAMYRHQAYLYQIWLQGFREQSSKQAAVLELLLNDPVFDPLRLPMDALYRNDPDATPYTTDYTQHFVGEDPLHTDAVELRRAPETVDFSSTPTVLLGGSPLVKFYGQSQGCRRRGREEVATINPALLQLRDPDEFLNLT
ncbi:uncharacterized protein N7496_007365 [Penicillium cataractarum]|uniref:Uncharacterized protein n=1 Tax=Penicillium cataractarum TaxID=2100454 RepID=A0A9W9V708_9EURO|nr:uncharacterized protein N7496_007365 [Penicillium cataractarum]KAJ5371273.1 hypothetical protein N7496_007365 [Penicillium cataractarum]